MKRLILIFAAVAALVSRVANAQELYQYTKDSVIQTEVGSIYIVEAYNSNLNFSKAVPAYEKFEPATSSNPSLVRNQEGFWNIDYSRFSKPSKTAVQNTLRLCFNQYLPILKTGIQGRGQVRIVIRTNSQGIFKNAEVKIWAEPSVYRQIPPAVLCNLLNSIDDLQFGIPTEYQCISDHYFRYSVFFKDL